MQINGTKRDLENQLTAVRGVVRRLPDSVEKERAILLAAQLEGLVPPAFIARQIEVMGGE